MCIGEPLPIQGEVQDPHRGWDHRRKPQPWEAFTGVICGTPEQWAGNLRKSRPEDSSEPGCCTGLVYHMGSFVTGGTPAAVGVALNGGAPADCGLSTQGGTPADTGTCLFGHIASLNVMLFGGSPLVGGVLLASGGESDAGSLRCEGTPATAGALANTGQDASPGLIVAAGQDAAAASFLFDGSFLEYTSGTISFAGSPAVGGTVLGSGTQGMQGSEVWEGVQTMAGEIACSGFGEPPATEAPCQGVSFASVVATISNVTGACGCLPSPWSPTTTGTDLALWPNPGTCTDTLLSFGVSCISGQYTLTCSEPGVTITLIDFVASPLSITWHVTGPSLCGSGGGSFDFTVS